MPSATDMMTAVAPKSGSFSSSSAATPSSRNGRSMPCTEVRTTVMCRSMKLAM